MLKEVFTFSDIIQKFLHSYKNSVAVSVTIIISRKVLGLQDVPLIFKINVLVVVVVFFFTQLTGCLDDNFWTLNSANDVMCSSSLERKIKH